jgi:transposase
MNSLALVAGIDVSKATLDVYFNDESGKERYLNVSNDKKGHALITAKLGTARTYVMENSGPYYLRLAFYLKQRAPIFGWKIPL